MQKWLHGRMVCVSVSPAKDDIVGYLRARLAEDEMPDAMDPRLEAEILEKIPENMAEIFLLVSLNIDSILQESTIYHRRERLRKIADGVGLEDEYGATIERIKAQGGGKSRLGMKALMWITHAERPLGADELCYALAVEPGSTDFSADNIPSTSTLVSCCQGLITVDKESSTVRLIHFTLKEYLCSRAGIFSRPHATIAEICLTYLSSTQVEALSAAPSPHTLDTPFLGYCSLYWGVHAKRELSDYARSLALSLLREYDGHISAKSLLTQKKDLTHKEWGTNFSFSGLHCASFFGIVEVVAALIEMKHFDINEQDILMYTPLAWAARSGHEEVVKILLRQADVNPNRQGMFGNAPLSCAAANGHEGVVKILLGRDDVNPESPDICGLTPLFYAAANGHEGVVKTLLGREEVNSDKQDICGITPLSDAAAHGHEGVVKILLAREEVNPDQLDGSGNTPLLLAAREGYQSVVKILLERDEVNPDKPNKFGQTPLHNAAQGGHQEVVKILLAREEVNPDKPDNHHSTPLSVAARYRHEDVVRILLGREEVNPEMPDNDGDTPLSCAALGGCEGVVKILLEQEGVNPDNPNNAGRTPLSHAACNAHAGVVKILLKQEEVNPNKADEDGQTPLMYAVRHGNQRVIELLQPHQLVTQGALSVLADTTPYK